MCQAVHMDPTLCCQEFPERPSSSKSLWFTGRAPCLGHIPASTLGHPSPKTRSRVTWLWPGKSVWIHRWRQCRLCANLIRKLKSVILCLYEKFIFSLWKFVFLFVLLSLLESAVLFINQHITISNQYEEVKSYDVDNLWRGRNPVLWGLSCES